MTITTLTSWQRYCKTAITFTRECSNFNSSKANEKHVYLRISEWKSLQQLVNVIKDRVIYNENGIVAINKPYGVGLAPPKALSKAARRIISGLDTATVGNSYYLTQVLPHLAKSLGYSDLTVLEIPERYTSGITILSTNNRVSEKVQECMLKAKRRDEFFESYWAVVLGTPCPESGFFRYALQYKIVPGSLHSNKRPVLAENFSNRSLKLRKTRILKAEHETLYKGNLTSLVEVRPNATKSHFLRLYLAQMLSPILGDNLYGSRVHRVMGVPLSVNPCSDAACGVAKLPEEMLKQLLLQPGQELAIPCHIHLRKITLPRYFGKNKDLVLEAQVPESFQWSCNALGLSLPTEKNEERLEISSIS